MGFWGFRFFWGLGLGVLGFWGFGGWWGVLGGFWGVCGFGVLGFGCEKALLSLTRRIEHLVVTFGIRVPGRFSGPSIQLIHPERHGF